MPSRRIALAAVAVIAALAPLTACGSSADLTIYSGRNEQLVGGLLEKLEERVGAHASLPSS